jgi:hypothetical protein
MWMPTTEQETLAAVGAGHPEGIPSFVSIEAPPAKGKSKDRPRRA